MRHYPFAFGVLLMASVAITSAQDAYRCGPDGSTFQQMPCAKGEAIDVGDRRSAKQRREAEGIAKREARLAKRLERERLKREAAIVPATATGINGQPIPQAASTPSASKGKTKSKRKNAVAKPFTARVPKPAKQ